jgi:hypothetical protein
LLLLLLPPCGITSRKSNSSAAKPWWTSELPLPLPLLLLLLALLAEQADAACEH